MVWVSDSGHKKGWTNLVTAPTKQIEMLNMNLRKRKTIGTQHQRGKNSEGQTIRCEKLKKGNLTSSMT